MEIIVAGKCTNSFVPDEVRLNINFFVKGNTYEEVLNKGTLNIQLFIEEVLLKNNFKKDDMKTRSFIIKEEKKYNEITRNYDFDGYSFSQDAILKFDYNSNLMSNIIVAISKFSNSLTCQINFDLKDEEKCRKTLLANAYKDAENKAMVIAKASGKMLKCCQKVDFRPFTNDYVSNTMVGNEMMYAEKYMKGAVQSIANNFTPEEIELTETLYCLWIAE